MTDRDPASPKSPGRAAREKRLAEALRANLRRRKGAIVGKAERKSKDGEPSSGNKSENEQPAASDQPEAGTGRQP